jgi:hypothetical protein
VPSTSACSRSSRTRCGACADRLRIPPDGERARLLAAAAVTGYRVGLEAWMSMHPRPEPAPVLRRTVTALVEPLAG